MFSVIQNIIRFIGCPSFVRKGRGKNIITLMASLDGFFQLSCQVTTDMWMLFFACSGNGNGTSWNNRGSNGNYWASSLNSSTNGRNLNFNSGGVNPQNNNNRFNGFAVRPVQNLMYQ